MPSNGRAAMTGNYADFKLVKTRSVVQMIIEIPIERGGEVTRMFGLPQPGEEIPVAVARLTAQPVEVPARPVTSWSDLPRSQQAGIRCSERPFREWWASSDPRLPGHDVVQFVYQACGVTSRSELDLNETAGKKWDALDLEFLQQTGRAARA